MPTYQPVREYEITTSFQTEWVIFYLDLDLFIIVYIDDNIIFCNFIALNSSVSAIHFKFSMTIFFYKFVLESGDFP